LYEAFYNLKENPFRLTPDPAFLCMTAQHREALAGLIYAVHTRPGLTVLVGEAGTGKTTLLYALKDLLEKRGTPTAICTNPTLTRQEFYDVLMIKFGVACESALKSRQLTALEEHFRLGQAEGRPALLVIDEAQRLSVELLEEIRLLLNIETTREKLVEIVLAGQPELLETLGRPEMRQLKQRVSCICKLKPMDREELRELLFHRLSRAGLPEQTLFPATCIDLIYEYTHGIPRLVNTLCDSTLQVGFGMRSAQIGPAIIEEAARDLELVRDTSAADLSAATAATSLNTAPPAPVLPNGSANHAGNGNGGIHRDPEPPNFLQTYSDRQKSLGFFANLIAHWR
jgi:general secretion pathway protein A